VDLAAAIDPGLKLGHPALLSDSACSLQFIHKYIRSPHTMRQHFHREMIFSIISTLQTRTAAGLTTHLGKVKAHNNSMGNDQIDNLTDLFAHDQPPDATYFIEVPTHV
jgi:hypothetical protein